MPLYEYRCEKCGRFESLQKVSDAPLQACPTCGSVVEKLLSAPAFQFKGSGWYVTDYARSDASGSGSKDPGAKGSESKPSAASSGSSESSTPPSADSKSSTNSPPKEGAGSAASSMAPAANSSQ